MKTRSLTNFFAFALNSDTQHSVCDRLYSMGVLI